MRPKFEIDKERKYPIIWRKKGSKVTDPCPYCDELHIHGIGEGHRVAHCVDAYDRRGDIIRDSSSYTCNLDGEIIHKSEGYILRDYND